MMNDLISRQAAIDTLDKHLRTTDVPVSYPGIISALTEWLNELPSAQPDSKELSGTHKALDTVSRQAVIEAINKIFPADPMRDDYTQGITCGAALANIYVAQLPSAQPEKRTEERTETHACDCISRQAAIDYCYQLINVEHQQGSDEMNYGQERVNQTETILHHLELMPSVQPEQTNSWYINSWCNNCKEYDKEKHSCPRFNRVIKQTLDEIYAHAETEAESRFHAQQRWIPCSERLPEANGRYLVTRGLVAAGALWNRVYIANYSNLMGIKSVKIWWQGNVGKSDFERLDDVFAWQPLPEPCREGEQEC